MTLISVVVPCFNEEKVLPHFFSAITEVAGKMTAVDFELLFIDDGSTDGTLSLLRSFAQKDRRVRYYSFSRNFGKEAAMFAGLEKAAGEYVAVMDADLQDPPSLIPEMYDAVQSGEYDCVATRRKDRKGESLIRSASARLFYKMINRVSNLKLVEGARDFRLMSRQMADAVLSMKEYNRFSKGIFEWVGFRTKWIEFENVARKEGETKWSFWKLFLYSLDGLAAFSTAPLAIASFVGIILFIISVIMIIVIIVKTLIWGDPVAGWPALACIVFFVGGIQLLCTGIAGQYIAKSYIEIKGRPIYIVKETNAHDIKP
jgi:glycosyltransferase involved in cell wall biosynthesis